MNPFIQRYLIPVAAALVVGAALMFAVGPLVGWLVAAVGTLGIIFSNASSDAKFINQIRITAEKVESGVLPDPLPTTRTDELGTLAAAINRLGRHDKATQQANTDPLTGLANRRGILQKLDNAFKRNQPLALFYLDLDKFKPVNDQYGHEMGDAVLKKVAELFLACVRDNDTVARLGGDEFLIAFYGLTDKALIEERAKKVLELINEPIWVNDVRIKLGASIGITVAPQDGATVEALMHAADETMYAVKKAGRNAYKFYS
ncbi:MAG: GGDEF domain-containing protein [Proteobacteria bacterium]|nr:GGDEF domain-containing protein [Pseudomonadota bacterium]NBX86419.1 GGDEF domain-containing protein [Pseudomonadota bacterium]